MPAGAANPGAGSRGSGRLLGCFMPGLRDENVAVDHAGVGPTRRLTLVGRTSELGEVERFLAPGSAARARGFAALCARASEAEARLSFAGLADLLEATGPDVLTGLPAPQRHALEVAVRRAEPGGPPPEPLAISAGLLATLRVMSGSDPVLVAVDDLPWLDRASAEALLFAARRLSGHDVRYLVSRRDGPSAELERVLERSGVVPLAPRPLTLGALSGLLADRLG